MHLRKQTSNRAAHSTQSASTRAGARKPISGDAALPLIARSLNCVPRTRARDFRVPHTCAHSAARSDQDVVLRSWSSVALLGAGHARCDESRCTRRRRACSARGADGNRPAAESDRQRQLASTRRDVAKRSRQTIRSGDAIVQTIKAATSRRISPEAAPKLPCQLTMITSIFDGLTFVFGFDLVTF